MLATDQSPYTLALSFGTLDARVGVSTLKENGGSIALQDTDYIRQHYNTVTTCSIDSAQPFSLFGVQGPSSTFVALGGEDGLVTIWRLREAIKTSARFALLRTQEVEPTVELVQVLTGLKAKVEVVCVNAALQLVATIDAAGQLYLHSTRDGQYLREIALKQALEGVLRGSYRSLHAEAICSTTLGEVIVLLRYKQDHKTKRMLVLFGDTLKVLGSRLIEEEEESILPTLYCSRDGTKVVYCHKKGFRITSIRKEFETIREIECKPPCAYTCFTVSPDEQVLLAGLEDGSLIAFGLLGGL